MLLVITSIIVFKNKGQFFESELTHEEQFLQNLLVSDVNVQERKKYISGMCKVVSKSKKRIRLIVILIIFSFFTFYLYTSRQNYKIENKPEQQHVTKEITEKIIEAYRNQDLYSNLHMKITYEESDLLEETTQVFDKYKLYSRTYINGARLFVIEDSQKFYWSFDNITWFCSNKRNLIEEFDKLNLTSLKMLFADDKLLNLLATNPASKIKKDEVVLYYEFDNTEFKFSTDNYLLNTITKYDNGKVKSIARIEYSPQTLIPNLSECTEANPLENEVRFYISQ